MPRFVRFAMLAALAAAAPARPQTVWRKVDHEELAGHAMAADLGRQRVVLFGGGNLYTLFGDDTREWDGSRWLFPNPVVRPPGRVAHAMVYDVARGRTVLFGGDAGGSARALDDMWSWGGDSWRELFPATRPPRRSEHGMAYDVARDRIVLFGGGGYADTWEFDGYAWVQQRPAVSPPPGAAALAYDERRGVTVFYGGQGAVELGELWEWDGSTWTQRTVPTAPQPRRSASLAYDRSRGCVVLFGGTTRSGAELEDVWEWDGTSWTRKMPSPTPGVRDRAPLAYDPGGRRLVLFGGYLWSSWYSRGSDTWAWDGSTWVELIPPASLPKRERHGAAYDASRQKVVVYGGYGPRPLAQDMWEWDGSVWRQRNPPAYPNSWVNHRMVYDAARDRIVLFGGSSLTFSLLAETWEWDGDGWSQQFPATTPPARRQFAMAYDFARGRVVMHGGFGSPTSVLGDTWEYDGTDWIERSPSTNPPATAQHDMAYDAHRRRVVMHDVDGRTWEWDGSDWALRTSTNSPGWRVGHAMAYDPQRGVTVLVGGGPWGLPETWEWDGSDWARRVTPTALEDRYGAGLVYDQARRELVLCGGKEWWQNKRCSTWTYSAVNPAAAEPFGRGCSGTAGVPVLHAASIGPWLGVPFTLRVSNVPATNVIVLFVGASNASWGDLRLPRSLAGYGMADCHLYVSPDIAIPAITTWTTTIPPMASIVGRAFYSQAFAVDPPANALGVVSSNGFAARIGER